MGGRVEPACSEVYVSESVRYCVLISHRVSARTRLDMPLLLRLQHSSAAVFHMARNKLIQVVNSSRDNNAFYYFHKGLRRPHDRSHSMILYFTPRFNTNTRNLWVRHYERSFITRNRYSYAHGVVYTTYQNRPLAAGRGTAFAVYFCYLHGLGVYSPHVDCKILSSSGDQVISVAADRQGADLAWVCDKAHHLVGVPIKRNLYLLGCKWQRWGRNTNNRAMVGIIRRVEILHPVLARRIRYVFLTKYSAFWDQTPMDEPYSPFLQFSLDLL